MPESDSARRRPTNLSAETKWEIFLQVTAGEISQAEAARKSGRPGAQRDWQLEAARAEIAQLTEAVKAQAIELAVVRGKSGWG